MCLDNLNSGVKTKLQFGEIDAWLAGIYNVPTFGLNPCGLAYNHLRVSIGSFH